MVEVNCWVDSNGYYVCELKGKVCPNTYQRSITDFYFNVPPGYDLSQASMWVYITTYLAQGGCGQNFNLTVSMGVNQFWCPGPCCWDFKAPFEVGKQIQSKFSVPPGTMDECFSYGNNFIRFSAGPLGGLCFPWGVVCADIDAYVYFPPLPSVPPSPSPSPRPTSPINYLPYVILLALILGGGSAVIAYFAKPRAPLVQIVTGKT